MDETRSAYLAKTVVDLPFTSGLDEGIDELLGEHPVLTIAQNCRYNKAGGLSRRNGWREVALTNLPASNIRAKRSAHVFTHNGNLILQTHAGVYSYSNITGNWFKRATDGVPPFEYYNNVSVRNTWRSRNYDNAQVDGFVITVWSQDEVTDTREGQGGQTGVTGQRTVTSEIYYQIREANTGSVVVPSTLLADFLELPYVTVSDDRYVVFTAIGDNGGVRNILVKYIDIQNTSLADLSTPISAGGIDSSANVDIKFYDIAGDNAGDAKIWVAYTADGNVAYRTIDITGTTTTEQYAFTTIDDDIPCSIYNSFDLTVGSRALGITHDNQIAFVSPNASVISTQTWRTTGVGTQPTTTLGSKLVYTTCARAPDGRWLVAESRAPYSTGLESATSTTGIVPSTIKTGYHAFTQTASYYNISSTTGVFTTNQTREVLAYLLAGHAFWMGDAYEFGLPLQAQLGAYYRGPNVFPGVGLFIDGLVATSGQIPHCLLVQPTATINNRPRVLCIFHHDRADDFYGDEPSVVSVVDGFRGWDYLNDQWYRSHLGHVAEWVPADAPTEYILTRAVRLSLNTQRRGFRDRFGQVLFTPGVLEEGNMGGDEARFIPEGYNNRVINAGNYTYISAGVLAAYDGRILAENSILGVPPVMERATPIETNGGTDIPPSGGNSIGQVGVFVWKWRDHQGNLHRTAPSLTSDSSGIISGHGDAWRWFIKKPPLPLGVSSSEAENMDLQLDLYVSGNVSGGPGGNYDPTLTLVWSGDAYSTDKPYYDRRRSSDAPLVYVGGGRLASEFPPCFTDISLVGNRLFGLSAETRNDVWYSLQKEPDIAFEFNAAFRFSIPDEGGYGTGLARIQDRLIIFKQSAIYYVTGEGPTNTGQGNALTAPKALSVHIGCTNKNSIVEGVFGVMFQGQAGIYVLTPRFELKLLKNAEDTLLASGGRITHAINVPRESVVLFMRDDSRVAVYNYHFDLWSTDTNYDITDTGNRHATIWNDNLVWVSSDWQPHEMRPSDVQDAGQSNTRPPFQVTTSWIKLAGLGGFQRVWQYSVFAVPKDNNARFTVGLERDFVDGTYQSDQFSNADGDFNVVDGVATVDAWVTRQRCRAIRLNITDTSMTESSGYTISGISLLAGIIKGLSPSTPVGSGN